MEKIDEYQRYLQYLCSALGHADRNSGLVDYCQGLMLPIERKSVEPLAACSDPLHVQAKHQSLHHFVAQSEWSDQAILTRAREWVIPSLKSEDGSYWIVDDSGIPKKGKHSVGVARQYCGQLGKQDNCQVAVSLSLATNRGSIPVSYRLYLPKEWAEDIDRCKKAGIPEGVSFQKKPRIALEQIRTALMTGVPVGTVLADAGYGDDTDFRDALRTEGLVYAVGIKSGTTVWTEDSGPLPSKKWQGKGRKPTLLRRGRGHRPASVRTIAMEQTFRKVSWREGTNGMLSSHFARIRVRPAHKDFTLTKMRDEEWLIIEWPENEMEPTKYWLSTLPIDTPMNKMVRVIKMRWRIERDYEELKQEFGLAQYEGRNWRGFHHHGTLCIAAYAFLIAQRLKQFDSKKKWSKPKTAALSKDYKPRGSRPSSKTCAEFDSNDALSAREGNCQTDLPLSLLRHG